MTKRIEWQSNSFINDVFIFQRRKPIQKPYKEKFTGLAMYEEVSWLQIRICNFATTRLCGPGHVLLSLWTTSAHGSFELDHLK